MAQDGTVQATAQGLTFTTGIGTFEISKLDVKIGGLTLPSFTGGWLAYNLASGVLAGVGGMIFSALGEALGFGGPSIASLLQEQLRQVDRIVNEALERQKLQSALEAFDAVVREMHEYMRAPAGIDRLHYATDRIDTLVSVTKNIGFPSHLLHLSCCSLHLAILQERCKLDPSESENIIQALHEHISSAESAATVYGSVMSVMRSQVLIGWQTVIQQPVLGIYPERLPRIAADNPLVKARADVRRRELLVEEFKRSGRPDTIMIETRVALELEVLLEKDPRPVIAVVDWDAVDRMIGDTTIRPGAPTVDVWRQMLQTLMGT